MHCSMDTFWHAFIPLCVAFDGAGLLPVYWALAQHLNPAQRARAVTEASLTAFAVAVGFLFVSRFVFSLMGLTIADLMVAGGSILFVLSLRDLLLQEKLPKASRTSPGIVPLGVPLLSGPAVLTTVLLVRDQYGWAMTVTALIANMLLVWAMLHGAESLMQRLGREGTQVVSKISSVILTAFGVMLMRHGVTAILAAQR